MQTVVLSIFEVSEHDNQPELEHELLPQYVIDPENTMELSVSSETTFFNKKLQLEICPQLRTGSSAEDRGRIDTSNLLKQVATGTKGKNRKAYSCFS